MSGVLMVLAGIALLWLLLYPVADYWIRYGGPILRKIPSSTGVALTFDDGPDPSYTPSVLDILYRFNVKATFFLVGRQAAQYPDLVSRIREEGHEIALHSQSHRHAYTLLWGTFREIAAARDTVADLLNKPIVWYRPPWGAFNFLTLSAIRRCGLKPVTWSVNADDWLLKTGPEGVRRLIRERIHPGAVIVLHDHGGDPGAPGQTVEALPDILSDLTQAGLEVTTLSHLYTETHKEGVNHG